MMPPNAHCEPSLDLLAQRGADVCLVDLRQGPFEQAAAEIAKLHGVKTLGLAVDVAVWEQVEAAVKETVAKLGRLDCAFNAAGLPGRIGPGYLMADYPVE
jgi:NAD(P)-dependent dehydrogenase (short-subunit alcohol dehydrogenase family)